MFRYDTGELISEQYSAKILVVEDDEFFMNMVIRVISRMGHQATGAKNGIEAVEVFKSGDFDLVIVDLYPFEDTVASGAAEQDIIEVIARWRSASIPLSVLNLLVRYVRLECIHD